MVKVGGWSDGKLDHIIIRLHYYVNLKEKDDQVITDDLAGVDGS